MENTRGKKTTCYQPMMLSQQKVDFGGKAYELQKRFIDLENRAEQAYLNLKANRHSEAQVKPTKAPRTDGKKKTSMEVSYAIRLETHMVKDTAFPYGKENLSSCNSAFLFAQSLQKSDIEKLLICHLNAQNQLNCLQIFHGTVNMANVYPREIIKHTLLSASAAIILIHNHPSGCMKFSEKDISFTRQIKAAAELFDITVHDHVLVGGGTYVSMLEKKIFNRL